MTGDDLFLSGFEFLFFTDDRIESVIADMIDAGKITKEEAAKIRRTLVKKAEEEKRRFVADLGRAVEARIAALELVPRAELERLEKRVRALESLIDDMSKAFRRR